MSLETIAGKKVCGAGNKVNTGKLGCLVDLSTPEHLIAIRKGFVIPKETEFNLTYITEQTQRGNFIPVIGATAFEDMSAEDAYNTNASGIERLNLQGLPKYKLTYEEGHEFYKQLARLRSFKSYDFIVGDDQGNWSMVKNSDGDYKGYSMGHVTPEMTKRKVKGGDNESKSLVFQFLDRNQYDINYEIFNAQELGFYPDDVKAVNGVSLLFTAIPSAGDTKIEFKAVLTADMNTVVEGFETANVTASRNGVLMPITSLTETAPGEYEGNVAVLVLADVIEVNSNDAALSTDVVLVEGSLFRATSVSETVIA